MLKIATWNVNSLRVRLPHVLEWLQGSDVDVLALQETKLQDQDFPAAALQEIGYHTVFAGQKTYNGVAILSRAPLDNVVDKLPAMEDPQKRLLCASYQDIRIVNVYIPNGASLESDKFEYKIKWLAKLQAFLQAQLQDHPRLVLLGDFNIAPMPEDVYDPQQWEGKVLFSPAERAAFQDLLATGLCDTFRLFPRDEQQYSWWDYRMAAFRRNLGMRIDHILASHPLCAQCQDCRIDRVPRGWERPSDHTPVIAEFAIS